MTEEHEHNHDHEHEHNHTTPDDAGRQRQADPGYDYLSGALKVSFAVLKVIMVILVILFLFSGVTKIAEGERAIVLWFGKISGVGEERVLGPGLKLLLPYPIHEVVRIPGEKGQPGNQFVLVLSKPGEEMDEAANEKSYAPPTLNPITDGYCLVRGEKQENPSLALRRKRLQHPSLQVGSDLRDYRCGKILQKLLRE